MTSEFAWSLKKPWTNGQGIADITESALSLIIHQNALHRQSHFATKTTSRHGKVQQNESRFARLPHFKQTDNHNAH